MTESHGNLSPRFESHAESTVNTPSRQDSEEKSLVLVAPEVSLDISPGPWHTVPHHHSVRCGTGYALNNKHISTCGIYQSNVGSGLKSDLLSLFYIDEMRRYPIDPTLFDVILHNPQTGEQIEVVQASARDIAQTIHRRCGSPYDPLTRAIYALLSGMCMEINQEREDPINE